MRRWRTIRAGDRAVGKAHVGLLTATSPRRVRLPQGAGAESFSEVALAWLGVCFAKQGEIAAAIAHFDRALAIKPDYEDAITRKIFTLDFLPDADFALHQAARREWWERIGAQLPRRPLRRANLDPERRLDGRLRLLRFPRSFGGAHLPAGAAPSRPPGSRSSAIPARRCRTP